MDRLDTKLLGRMKSEEKMEKINGSIEQVNTGAVTEKKSSGDANKERSSGATERSVQATERNRLGAANKERSSGTAIEDSSSGAAIMDKGKWITPNILFAETRRIYDVSPECLEAVIPLMCRMFPGNGKWMTSFDERLSRLLNMVADYPNPMDLPDSVIERTTLLLDILNRCKDGKI